MLRFVIDYILTPLASLKLTVALMAASMVLIFAGTWAQIDTGIWAVLEEYFRTAYVAIPLSVFLPRDPELLEQWALLGQLAKVSVPWPGGFLLGPLLLVNLLAAHILRFKIKAAGSQLVFGLVALAIAIAVIVVFHLSHLPQKTTAVLGEYWVIAVGFIFYLPLFISVAILFYQRCGIILIHAAIILLIAGEGVTAAAAAESMMPIYNNETINWTHDIREYELAVIDPDHPETGPEEDHVIVVPQDILESAAESGELIRSDELPFDIRVDRIIPNTFHQPVALGSGSDLQPLATDGVARTHTVVEMPPASGVSGGQADMPAAVVTLLNGEQRIGQFLVAIVLQYDDYKPFAQPVVVDGRRYEILLRYHRRYQPFAIHLDQFHHDLYPGTNIPLNFSSDIQLIDQDRGIDQRKVIKMNHPLRYQGLTFFQSGWIPGDRGTVLQVVRNPGAALPYIACSIGGVGLLIHFVLVLFNFLRRQMA